MANTYLYGAYGHLGESAAQNAVQAGTVAVYVGTAPVNLVRGYAAAGVVNSPVKVANFTDAQRRMGYSPDWEGFTLCEAFGAHFNNHLGNIGPIYVINVLDPDVHAKAQPTTLDMTFVNGRAEFASDTIILDTFE
ncbi:MAG: phage tail sheath family protein, partial [Oscillospiraceae bacterium]|nr:phage tail sheath family protein [Oscillospiraceae bacterium]